jgi:hypothetical protein
MCRCPGRHMPMRGRLFPSTALGSYAERTGCVLLGFVEFLAVSKTEGARAVMSSSQTVDRNASHLAQAQGLLLPVAAVVFLFTVSYPANDFITASKPSDIGLGMFLVYAAIAGMTVGVLFLLVLPWAFRREASGGLALALAIVGAGFWLLDRLPSRFGGGGCVARVVRRLRTQGSHSLPVRLRDRPARHARKRTVLCGRIHLTDVEERHDLPRP